MKTRSDRKSLVERRVASVDELVKETAAAAAASLGLEEKDWLVLAVGGFGCGRLAPGSDVDLAVIHRSKSSLPLGGFIKALLYPLWDAGLPVSHIVKNLNEAARAGRADFYWLTSALENRFIAGDRRLHEVFCRQMAAIAVRQEGRPFLTDMARDFKERAGRYGYVGRRLEPEIKEGVGGLRDIQALFLIDKLFPGMPAPLELAEADCFFQQLRRVLHEVSGKKNDRLTSAVLPDIAAAILPDQPPERLYARLFVYARLITSSLRAAFRRAGIPVDSGDTTMFLDVLSLERGAARRRLFLSALTQGAAALPVLEDMSQSGVTEKLIPSWRSIKGLARFDPGHVYPVDTHAFMTVLELAELLDGKGVGDELAIEVGRDIAHPEWLLLAGLLHDIGKGGEGPHAAAGVSPALEAADRLGIDRHGRETIGFLVENHLLLSHTAVRRDLDDPRAISSTAAAVGDVERLKMLYLLTIADAAATGPGIWNDWRSTLVKELFLKTRAELDGRTGPDRSEQVVLTEKHFALLEKDEPVQTVFWPAGEGYGEIAVVAPDQPGLFARITGTLALNGLNVLAARVYTTGDGRALEVFKVAGIFEPKLDRLPKKVGEDLKKAGAGKIAIAYHLDRLDRRYRRPAAGKKDPRVLFDNEASETLTVVEVQANDEIGLLYKIGSALYEMDCDIHLAKVSTVGAQAVDVFYLSNPAGRKIIDPEHLEEAEKNILFRLS